MRSISSLVAVLVLSPSLGVLAFTNFSKSPNKCSQLNASSEVTRREIFSRSGAVLAFTSTILSTDVRLAGAYDSSTDNAIAVTKKLASPAALRSIKQVARKLAKMEDLIFQENFEDVRLSLRVVPFTEVRKNANIIIGGLPDEDSERLKESYASFIQGLEGMDSQANLGQRGRKNVDMRPGYDQALQSLLEFLDEAEKQMDVPVKYTDATAQVSEVKQESST